MLSFPSYKQDKSSFIIKKATHLSKKASKYIKKKCLLYKMRPSFLLQYKGKKYLSIIYKDKEQKLQNNQKESNQYEQKL